MNPMDTDKHETGTADLSSVEEKDVLRQQLAEYRKDQVGNLSQLKNAEAKIFDLEYEKKKLEEDNEKMESDIAIMEKDLLKEVEVKEEKIEALLTENGEMETKIKNLVDRNDKLIEEATHSHLKDVILEVGIRIHRDKLLPSIIRREMKQNERSLISLYEKSGVKETISEETQTEGADNGNVEKCERITDLGIGDHQKELGAATNEIRNQLSPKIKSEVISGSECIEESLPSNPETQSRMNRNASIVEKLEEEISCFENEFIQKLAQIYQDKKEAIAKFIEPSQMEKDKKEAFEKFIELSLNQLNLILGIITGNSLDAEITNENHDILGRNDQPTFQGSTSPTVVNSPTRIEIFDEYVQLNESQQLIDNQLRRMELIRRRRLKEVLHATECEWKELKQINQKQVSDFMKTRGHSTLKEKCYLLSNSHYKTRFIPLGCFFDNVVLVCGPAWDSIEMFIRSLNHDERHLLMKTIPVIDRRLIKGDSESWKSLIKETVYEGQLLKMAQLIDEKQFNEYKMVGKQFMPTTDTFRHLIEDLALSMASCERSVIIVCSYMCYLTEEDIRYLKGFNQPTHYKSINESSTLFPECGSHILLNDFITSSGPSFSNGLQIRSISISSLLELTCLMKEKAELEVILDCGGAGVEVYKGMSNIMEENINLIKLVKSAKVVTTQSKKGGIVTVKRLLPPDLSDNGCGQREIDLMKIVKTIKSAYDNKDMNIKYQCY